MGSKKSTTQTDEIVQLSYEQAFAELEKIVRELESEQSSLETTLALFERGQGLVQHCNALLEQADLRLQVLGAASIPNPLDEDDE